MRRSSAGRDQQVSPFSAILHRFCDSTGVVAAALVDAEGETVDYAGELSPFDIKIAAAECAVLLGTIRVTQAFDWIHTQELVVRGRARSFAAFTLSDGYSLIAVLSAGAFAVSQRALQQVLRGVCDEAGLGCEHPCTQVPERWERVDVFTPNADRRRPSSVWLDGAWRDVEVLGRFDAGGGRDIGYRVRLSNGDECGLVRERLGVWYVELSR
ncbi:MAG: hypothetical protein KIT72_05275 [Polyangiaceae bacterium]|nr:hypothetical protein [Polyangiaceae bacterium]MCW5789809.1 hypothetical protein [Polyangiaceae bacterium]